MTHCIVGTVALYVSQPKTLHISIRPLILLQHTSLKTIELVTHFNFQYVIYQAIYQIYQTHFAFISIYFKM